MGLKKLAQKVDEYNERLQHGKANKIKPSHVKEVLEKLRKKEADLEAHIASARHDDARDRYKRKLKVTHEHIERAEWLLNEIS